MDEGEEEIEMYLYRYDWCRFICSLIYVCERKHFRRATDVARARILAAREQQDWYRLMKDYCYMRERRCFRCAIDAARAYILAAQERARLFERACLTRLQ